MTDTEHIEKPKRYIRVPYWLVAASVAIVILLAIMWLTSTKQDTPLPPAQDVTQPVRQLGHTKEMLDNLQQEINKRRQSMNNPSNEGASNPDLTAAIGVYIANYNQLADIYNREAEQVIKLSGPSPLHNVGLPEKIDIINS